jgi:restriction endonuclease Mrr
MAKVLTVTVTIEDDSLLELLEEYDVKPSKAKVNKLKKLVDDVYPDAQEVMEDALREFLGDMIQEEWEK